MHRVLARVISIGTMYIVTMVTLPYSVRQLQMCNICKTGSRTKMAQVSPFNYDLFCFAMFYGARMDGVVTKITTDSVKCLHTCTWKVRQCKLEN
jgi:hypothetical protein